LAEPNLVALSGDTANFLAGGEFPIPVSQDEDTITVEFKEFGVGLAFTPTVLGDSLMNLVVKSEVSALDRSDQGGAVTLSGFDIPALVTRRAETTIELRDGQSFAIAGLFQDNFTNGVDQLPWIGDVPILGLLFRSADFQKNQTELVIIVTPHLVAPGDATAMSLPTDSVAEPTDLDLFFHGRTEGFSFPKAVGPSGATQLLQSNRAGGVSGDYGYIIE
jgi:pilus assembly protein CpaC